MLRSVFRWRARGRWRDGLVDEESFWADWIRTRGGAWAEDYAFRADPESELQPHVRAFVRAGKGAVRLLDVGAGPMTVLGKRIDGAPVEIVAVDPLAPVYDRLLEEHGVKPPVRTVRCDGERLCRMLGRDRFDLSYARNCLDHAYDPVWAIREMLRVTKPGGTVLLEHLADEGEHERYKGLHQWNFTLEGESFVVWRPGTRIDVSERLGRFAHVQGEREDRWVRIVLTRR